MDNAVYSMIYWFLSLATWVSSLMIIYGGVKYILARRNKEKRDRAGKILIYGLAILLVSGFVYTISLSTFNPNYLH